MTTKSIICVIDAVRYNDLETRLTYEQKLRANVPCNATTSWLEWSCLEALDGTGDQRWCGRLTWKVK